MTFQIVTDSSCNLTSKLIDECELLILPLTFTGNGKQYKSYLKGQEVDLKQFYTMMQEGVSFTTSLPNLADSRELLEGILEQGDDILYIGFSSALSGTFDAIKFSLRELGESYPERTILAVDTLAASAGEGLLVWHAAQMRQKGATILEVRDWLEENKLKLAHWFTVNDLLHLMRGGRVSAVSAYAGTMLNIKPVMHVDDEGKLVPMEKVRGRKKSLLALVDHMEKTACMPVKDQLIFITHGDCLKDAEFVADNIRQRFGEETEIVINYVDPVIGVHTGPGVVALFFLAENRD